MYSKQQDAHTSKNGNYSKYEKGIIHGLHRNMPAIIADEMVYDSLECVPEMDNCWHVFNLLKYTESGTSMYVDSIAIKGAMDVEHALYITQNQLDSIGADYATLVSFNQQTEVQALWSLDSIGKLMNNISQNKHYLPAITAAELQAESKRVTFDEVQWDGIGLISHSGDEGKLLLDMVKCDTANELLSPYNLSHDLQNEAVEEAAYDSLMDTKNRLPLLKDRLFRAMSDAGTDNLSVTSTTISKPFKRQGVANIAVTFDLSDGQTLAIWFHNPDSTPTKLLPDDIMISWKWLLNRRDVTAVLQPKHGVSVKLPTLARRIMKLAHKNSARFVRTQKKRAETEKALADTQQKLDEKTLLIEQLDKDIERLKEQIKMVGNDNGEAKTEQAKNIDVNTVDKSTTTTPIEITGNEFGEFEDNKEGEKALRKVAIEYLAQLKGQFVDCPALSAVESDTRVEIRQRGIDHIESFSADTRKLKILHDIKRVIKTAVYIHSKENIKKESKPQASTYHYLKNKVSIGKEKFEFVIVVEKDTDGMLHYDILTNKYAKAYLEETKKMEFDNLVHDEEPWVLPNSELNHTTLVASDASLFDSMQQKYVLNLFLFDENGNEILDEEDSEADNQLKDTSITLTGNEIEVGENVDFKTAKDNAMAYFDANLKDSTVFCPAVNDDVLLRRRGGKHIAKSHNTYRDKLKLVPAIPEMIKRGKHQHYTEAKKRKGSNIEGYHVLSVKVTVGDDIKNARVVLEKNNEGDVLYDIGINKKEALIALGGTDNSVMLDGFTESSQYQGLDKCYQNLDDESSMFDKVSNNNATGNMVLNLFLFDESGDEIVDEAEDDKEGGNQVMTSQTTEQQQDKDCLQSILDGNVDVMADDFDDALMEVVLRVGEDNEVVKQVMDYYLEKLSALKLGE